MAGIHDGIRRGLLGARTRFFARFARFSILSVGKRERRNPWTAKFVSRNESFLANMSLVRSSRERQNLRVFFALVVL